MCLIMILILSTFIYVSLHSVGVAPHLSKPKWLWADGGLIALLMECAFSRAKHAFK